MTKNEAIGWMGKGILIPTELDEDVRNYLKAIGFLEGWQAHRAETDHPDIALEDIGSLDSVEQCSVCGSWIRVKP